MNVKVFAPTNEYLGELSIDGRAELPTALKDLHSKKPLLPGTYVESGNSMWTGSTWTLVSVEPFELKPGLISLSNNETPVGTSSAPPPINKSQTSGMEGYLAYLESNSSCKGFRGSIRMTFWVNLSFWLGVGGWAAIKLVDSRSSYEPGNARDVYEATFLYSCVAAFFAINALIVLRQLVLLVTNYLDSKVVKAWEEWVVRPDA